MARIESWFEQDLKEPVRVRYIDGNVFSMDNEGNLVGVNVYDNKIPASLSGSVSANIIRPDGITVAVSGTLSGNKVSVILPQEAYYYTGMLSIIIKLTSGSVITTLCAVVVNVYQSSTDSIVDPGTIIPSIETLIAEIEAAVASIPADYSDLWTSLAPEFSTSVNYVAGQYVTYNGGLYRFVTAHSGTWNSSDVDAVTVGGDVFNLKGELSENSLLFPYKVDSYRPAGLALNYIGNGYFHVQGSVSQEETINIINTTGSGLPFGWKAGSKLIVRFKTTASNIRLEIFSNTSAQSTSGWTGISYEYTHDDFYEVTLPSDCASLLVRLKFYSGNSYNEDLACYILNKYPNLSYPESYIPFVHEALPTGTDLDDVLDNGVWLLPSGSSWHYPNNPDLTVKTLIVLKQDNVTIQVTLPFKSSDDLLSNHDLVYFRACFNTDSDWSDWLSLSTGRAWNIAGKQNGLGYGEQGPINLNTVKEAGWWILYDSQTYTNTPSGMGTIGFLCNILTGGWRYQIILNWNANKMWLRRGNEDGSSWTGWNELSGSGNTYNITNNYSFPEYSQSVTVNASPSITTDTNDYLASTGTTADRTTDILTMLTATGICRLGPGKFYIKDLAMPDGSAIIGSGYATEIHMIGTADGYAIKLGSYCSLKDFRLIGADTDPTFGETIGGRHGLLWQGDYTQSRTAPFTSMVSDIWIRGFTGGGITCYDTGYGTSNALEVTNVYIAACWAGINISYWSEFHKFTNVRSYSCRIGCVNNGGNNLFVNCDFSSNQEIAMLMDNSQGQSPNNTHGSCIGCVFNHTAHSGTSNSGIGIEILNCHSGFVFTGCQIFYSQIYLVDTDGIVVADTNFGNDNCDVTISGGGAVVFANNMVEGAVPITISNNGNVHFANNYNKFTGAEWKP